MLPHRQCEIIAVLRCHLFPTIFCHTVDYNYTAPPPIKFYCQKIEQNTHGCFSLCIFTQKISKYMFEIPVLHAKFNYDHMLYHKIREKTISIWDPDGILLLLLRPFCTYGTVVIIISHHTLITKRIKKLPRSNSNPI